MVVNYLLVCVLFGWLVCFIDMLDELLFGDVNLFCVVVFGFGVFEWLDVLFGYENCGIFYMLGGQSDNLFLLFFGVGYEDWVKGCLILFLFGLVSYMLVMQLVCQGFVFVVC